MLIMDIVDDECYSFTMKLASRNFFKRVPNNPKKKLDARCKVRAGSCGSCNPVQLVQQESVKLSYCYVILRL